MASRTESMGNSALSSLNQNNHNKKHLRPLPEIRRRAFLVNKKGEKIMYEIQHVIVNYENLDELLEVLEWCWL